MIRCAGSASRPRDRSRHSGLFGGHRVDPHPLPLSCLACVLVWRAANRPACQHHRHLRPVCLRHHHHHHHHHLRRRRRRRRALHQARRARLLSHPERHLHRLAHRLNRRHQLLLRLAIRRLLLSHQRVSHQQAHQVRSNPLLKTLLKRRLKRRLLGVKKPLKTYASKVSRSVMPRVHSAVHRHRVALLSRRLGRAMNHPTQ
jgi:hypothetical protein